MQKLLATTALIATSALAVKISNQPDELCCEVFSEQDFGGVSAKYCALDGWFGPLEYTGISFVGDDAIMDHEGTFEFTHDRMESYRCGSEVSIAFCDGAFSKRWD